MKNYTNYKHQDEAIKRYKNKDFFGLLFDCGTGKTFTAIQIAEEKELPVIVIAPKNICSQWKNDIKELGKKESSVFVVDAQKRSTKKYQEELDRFLNS